MRIAAHHLIHAGEIVTVRSCLGHDTDKLGRPDWAAPWPDVQPLAVATRGYYASTRQLQETPSILRRLSRRLLTIRPTPPAARAAPIPTTKAVAQTGGL